MASPSKKQAPFSNTPRAQYRVVVLLGGKSAERDISLKTGTAVAQGLRIAGHDVVEVDPMDVSIQQFDFSEFDAVFIALHGDFGEDGCVQAILEERQIPFTGPNSHASRLAFSKSAAKKTVP